MTMSAIDIDRVEGNVNTAQNLKKARNQEFYLYIKVNDRGSVENLDYDF